MRPSGQRPVYIFGPGMGIPSPSTSTVELGDIGIFTPSLQSEGVVNQSDFNAAAHIKKKGVNIRAKKAFVKKMSEVPVERAL